MKGRRRPSKWYLSLSLRVTARLRASQILAAQRERVTTHCFWRARNFGRQVMGHIDLLDPREVTFWMRRLSISRVQLQLLADTLNKQGAIAPHLVVRRTGFEALK